MKWQSEEKKKKEKKKVLKFTKCPAINLYATSIASIKRRKKRLSERRKCNKRWSESAGHGDRACRSTTDRLSNGLAREQREGLWLFRGVATIDELSLSPGALVDRDGIESHPPGTARAFCLVVALMRRTLISGDVALVRGAAAIG